MSILQVGDFRFSYYDFELFNALRSSDKFRVVDKFSWSQYFNDYKYENFFEKLYYGCMNRYKIGPVINRINSDLIDVVEKGNYDVVFLWRAIHIKKSTLNEIKKKVIIVGYNNDQTQSTHHPWWVFWRLKDSLQSYDHFFSYRSIDVDYLKGKGVSSSLFIPTVNIERIYPKQIPSEKSYEVAFIGHYENDGRDELILNLLRAGYKVRLNGQRWSLSPLYQELKSFVGKIEPVYDGYNDALNSSLICLSLLSKLNQDTYTRRTLEIPATRSLMLAEFSDEQANMFNPGTEAVYFSSKEECIDLVKNLLSDKTKLHKIAASGYAKFVVGPYSMENRVDDIVKVTKKFRRIRLYDEK
ncbi:glycosyltransferase family 1 protein [Vibrio sp. F13]|nr:glycosyltransferase family 1 protein [Vibrio sp. F13]